MALQVPDLTSVARLVKAAGLYPAAVLPAGYHQSQPIPSGGPHGLRVGFLCCRAAVLQPKGGYQLFPPSYLAWVDAESGRFEELKALAPGEGGPAQDETKPIGTYPSPVELLAPEFLSRQASLYQLYDLLLPAFAAGQPAGAAVKKAAAEFKKLFPQVAEPPLLAYYQTLGKQFLAWVDKVSS